MLIVPDKNDSKISLLYSVIFDTWQAYNKNQNLGRGFFSSKNQNLGKGFF